MSGLAANQACFASMRFAVASGRRLRIGISLTGTSTVRRSRPASLATAKGELTRLAAIFRIPTLREARLRGRDLKFTHLTTNDGLSDNRINSILQDRRGFMWFATEDGLNRYDGNTFVVYKNNPDDPNTLSANLIQNLIEDGQGNRGMAPGAGLAS